MLLSFHDRLLISLSPQRINVLRLRKRLQWQTVEHKQLQLPQGIGISDALNELSKLLAELACPKCEATMVLAGGWVHYMLLEWDASLSGTDESAAFVRLKFMAVYGEAAKDWHFRWSLAHKTQAVASAVDGQLLTGARELLKSHGVGLVSVQPYLMTALNKWSRRIRREDCWLVLQEPGRVVLSFHEAGGRWLGLHTERFTGTSGDVLQSIMRRERVRIGLGAKGDAAKVWLAGSAGMGRSVAGDELFVDYPAGLDPQSHADYFMLLTALT